MTQASSRNNHSNPLGFDDVQCPICLDIMKCACETSCGHYFCGSCLLSFWNQSGSGQKICPMDRSIVATVIPSVRMRNFIATNYSELQRFHHPNQQEEEDQQQQQQQQADNRASSTNCESVDAQLRHYNTRVLQSQSLDISSRVRTAQYTWHRLWRQGTLMERFIVFIIAIFLTL